MRKDVKFGAALGILCALSITDGALTLLWIGCGTAVEVNPIMAPLLVSPILFMAIKLALVGMGSFILWRMRSRWLSAIGLIMCLLAYGAVISHHLRAPWDACDVFQTALQKR